MKKLLLLFVLFFTSFSLKAGEWIKIYEDSIFEIFLEDEYNEDYNGYLIWQKVVYKTSQKISKNKYYKYTLSLTQYNFSFTQRRDLNIIFYNKNGKVVDSYEPYYAEWNYLVPNSIGQYIADVFAESWIE